MAAEMARLEKNMSAGNEQAHLKQMKTRLTIQGTEITFFFRSNEEGEMPYPASGWLFQKIFSFKWHDEEISINEGEPFLQWRGAGPLTQQSTLRATWLFWTAKLLEEPLGRAEAPRPINRGLRRAAALLLISDCYPLLAWTISRWTHGPSRAFE